MSARQGDWLWHGTPLLGLAVASAPKASNTALQLAAAALGRQHKAGSHDQGAAAGAAAGQGLRNWQRAGVGWQSAPQPFQQPGWQLRAEPRQPGQGDRVWHGTPLLGRAVASAPQASSTGLQQVAAALGRQHKGDPHGTCSPTVFMPKLSKGNAEDCDVETKLLIPTLWKPPSYSLISYFHGNSEGNATCACQPSFGRHFDKKKARHRAVVAQGQNARHRSFNAVVKTKLSCLKETNQHGTSRATHQQTSYGNRSVRDGD
ncbi:hypothetical protein HaLaN_11816 [Haematococcus lacustris]|uniref:Uncharacterized protein n=1 Tax=Haematococcus lacustris TaxID=44745 RepID=A0A699Z8K0_HAELA|nr:hypothetical protein HaLaN_11816 [Haematococcus lacustris]